MGSSHVGQWLTSVFLQRNKEVVTICEGRERTGQQMLEQVSALCSAICHLGIKPEDRVGIAALNSEWYLDWLLAVPMAGAIIAPLNHRWSLEEAEQAVNAVGAVALVVDGHCLPWLAALCQKCPTLTLGVTINVTAGDPEDLSSLRVVRMADLVEQHLHPEQSPQPLPNPFHTASGVALVCFTSGTTGRPKGAALSHLALTVQSLAKLALAGYSQQDAYLHVAPLCHIGGISSALAALMAGSTHVFLPRFRADETFSALRAHQITALIAVPAMLSDLVATWRAEAAPAANGPLRNVSKLLVGGGAMNSRLAAEA